MGWGCGVECSGVFRERDGGGVRRGTLSLAILQPGFPSWDSGLVLIYFSPASQHAIEMFLRAAWAGPISKPPIFILPPSLTWYLPFTRL